MIGVCTAVVYDFPLLQQAILERYKIDNTHHGVIVGPVFNTEAYGVIINQCNILYEGLKKAAIELNNDNTFIADMKTRWFTITEGVSGAVNINVPPWVYITPIIIGIVALIMSFAWLYPKYDEMSKKYEKISQDIFDNDYRDDLPRTILQEADNERMYQNMDKLMDTGK